jgi:predicted GH43/DUF377 family glycosyl hydrolase
MPGFFCFLVALNNNLMKLKNFVLLAFIFAIWSCKSSQTGISRIDFDSFRKTETNPVLKADSTFAFDCPMKKTTVKWQRADVFNPAAVVKDGKIMLLYRAEDNPKANLGGRTSRIGLAESSDGINFKKYPKPVLYPAEDNFSIYDSPGGCEDPRVVQTAEGTYVMAYTAWNYDTPRLSIAFSKDLVTWEKKGPAFAKAYEGKFKNMATKSGSILTKLEGKNYVAAKINGKYWMYWGEHGVNLAWSENMYDWYPELDNSGNLSFVIQTRKGFFDSNLTECGPPAMITDDGVVLVYNGKNSDFKENASSEFPLGTYTVGRVVFDPKDLKTVLQRSDKPFLVPSLPHEITGQYKAGTTFAEGLVFFKNKWYLYYGTADSFVGLAISSQKNKK